MYAPGTDPDPFRPRQKPEAEIQQDVIKMLRDLDWYVQVMHGSIYQSGLPDLYCHHLKYRQRWIEIKYKYNYRFTRAQLENFPKMNDAGISIWILCEATPEEYQKLFQPQNWRRYLWNQGGKK
jgi:hypothetical protein